MNYKKLLLSLALISCSFFTFAQDGMRLGFKFSPLFATLRPTSDDFERSGSVLGFSYGLTGDFFFSKNYAFSTEFAISSMGGQMEFDHKESTVYRKVVTEIKSTYIEIPFLLKLKTNDFPGGLSAYGKFGLGTGINIKARANNTYYNAANAKVEEENIKKSGDLVQPFNLSLIIGGGVEYDISDSFGISAGVTYSNGFVNVIDKDFAYKGYDLALGATQSYISLNLALLF